MSKIRVAVLMGGISAERDISLSTGSQIVAALNPEKYDAFALDTAYLTNPTVNLPSTPKLVLTDSSTTSNTLVPNEHSVQDILNAHSPNRPDVVFIALHGKGGEDGSIQGMLEVAGIPYTGSGILASALAMDKSMAKRVLKSEGITVPGEIKLNRSNLKDIEEIARMVADRLGYPVIVKPNAQGSTIGCTILQSEVGLEMAVAAALQCDDSALIEQLIVGTEITVAVLGNDDGTALPIIEIDARGGFYDYQSKYAPGGSAHIIPARISEIAAEKARDFAVKAHKVLGCSGMSRVDMIVCGDDPVVLEVNTIPGMTPTSLLPDAARAAGIEFTDLLDQIIDSALNK